MKKKIFLIIILMLIVLYAPSVFATEIEGCKGVFGNDVNVAIDSKIANVVHGVILAIEIAVPIVLVIVGMLDLFKGITAQKEDEIKKGQQILIKRIISAALVFFVIAIVRLLVGLVSDNETQKNTIINCADCFLNGADSASGACK